MAKKRSLGSTLLLILLAAGIWLARSKGWLPEGEGDRAGPPASAPAPGGEVAPPPGSSGAATAEAPDEAEAAGRATGERTDDDFEDGSAEIVRAARSQRSGFMVTVRGEVQRTLADDLDGHRHQRFVLELSNGHTVLVAHNIDLAPRVPLEQGDSVDVHGQYEWNDRGGVLHWTHHDPQKRHEEGWIRHDGRIYD